MLVRRKLGTASWCKFTIPMTATNSPIHNSYRFQPNFSKHCTLCQVQRLLLISIRFFHATFSLNEALKVWWHYLDSPYSMWKTVYIIPAKFQKRLCLRAAIFRVTQCHRFQLQLSNGMKRFLECLLWILFFILRNLRGHHIFPQSY